LFELEPEYLCKFEKSEKFVICNAADLDKAQEWKLDETRNNLNLENWFTRLR